jgi:hypothetical protein
VDIGTLISICSARGISLDLGRPRKIPLAHRRGPKPRVVEADESSPPRQIPGVFTALGRQSDSRRIPKWTKADLGFAMAGASPEATNAFYWCINEDDRSGNYCRYKLIELALDLRDRQAWPRKLRRGRCAGCMALRCSHHYIEDLVSLALQEGAWPGVVSSDEVRATYFGLSETHFRRALGEGYASVYGALDNWLRNAMANLRRRLNDDDGFAEAATANQ